MLHRLLLSGFVALGVMATANVAAQPFTEAAAARAIRAASALSARIRGYHYWQGLTPPPASYCATMHEGEAVVKEVARLASRAILYRQPDLAIRLQSAGNVLSDSLDEEELINQQANIPFTVYPCPAPPGPYPARAYVLRIVEQRMPACRREADALRLSFEARRSFMQQCLRIPGS
jgi:psiF repeat